jgi:choline dehydrogenase
VTYVDKTATRVSSESAYLTKDVLARPNLTVAIHASVTKVLFEKSKEGVIKAIGVEFAESQNGPKYQAFAKKEVLLT